LDGVTYMNIGPKKCFRNMAMAGGGMAVVDLLIPNPGSWELLLQAVIQASKMDAKAAA